MPSPSRSGGAYGCLVVSIFQAEQSQCPTPLAVLTMALVRDALMTAGLERLRDACCRPRWRVSVADLKQRFSAPDLAAASVGGLSLSPGQSELHRSVNCITELHHRELPASQQTSETSGSVTIHPVPVAA